MYCEHCGEKIPEYSRFCEQCGKPVTIRVIPPQQNPPPAYATPSSRKPVNPGTSPGYSRIALWIRGRYGSRLTPGMDAPRMREQLEIILKSEQARGIPAKALKGFRAYIDQQQYETLLRPRG